MPKFANLRQVILKQKRGTKYPFLRRFVSLALKQGSNETFVASEKIFEDYCQAVAVWTDGDSLHGQTKYLFSSENLRSHLFQNSDRYQSTIGQTVAKQTCSSKFHSHWP